MEFQTDYLISWDVSDKDLPVISISRLRTEGKSVHLMVDVLDTFHSTIGVCSLRQIIEEFERKQRESNNA